MNEVYYTIILIPELVRLISLVIEGIILCMHRANEGRRYSVTPSLIGWARTEADPS